MLKENLNLLIEQGIKNNWNKTSLSNYKGSDYEYSTIANEIVKLHKLFDFHQLKRGDKIALVGKNSAEWGAIYLATITWGAVIVPILPDFKPSDIHHIVNHSDSVLLFSSESIFETLDEEQMARLKAIYSISGFKSLAKKGIAKGVYLPGDSTHVTQPEEFILPVVGNDELASLSYTSGTTGFTKGVMITHNNLLANVIYANVNMPLEPGDRIVSFLPLAHSYGCAFEFLWPFTLGCHVTFLTKTPSPPIILKAFAEVKPRLVLSVPLIMEKIYKKQILPVLQKPAVKFILGVPGLRIILYKKVKQKLMDSFGNNFHEVVIGGAPLSAEVEDFLNKIHFPFSIGYGMTECAPLISYAKWDKTRLRSAGKIVDTLEIKIHLLHPTDKDGEIWVRGENVMKGYYKNAEATASAIDEEGWLHTGDLGFVDDEGFIFIKGRSKSMILGPSGQNIYPEEIEARYNNLQYVQESLVTDRNGKMVALIYPDYETADKAGLNDATLKDIFEQYRKQLNKEMPSYMGVSDVKIFHQEFEKTPKKSIKRYLYND